MKNIFEKLFGAENKRKTINFLIAFIILVLTYILFIVITENDKSFNKELPVSNIENTGEIKGQKQLLQDEFYIMQSIIENQETYELSIYYPITTDVELNKSIDNRINLYIKDIKYQSSLYDMDVSKSKYKLDISFNTYKGSNDYLSFVFKVKMDTKWIHSNEYFFVINYDMKNKKLITEEDLQLEFKNLYVNLSEHAYNELIKNEDIVAMGATQMLIEGTKPNKYNFADLAFDSDNMLVLFERYQVAPYVLGSFEIRVPLDFLR